MPQLRVLVIQTAPSQRRHTPLPPGGNTQGPPRLGSCERKGLRGSLGFLTGRRSHRHFRLQIRKQYSHSTSGLRMQLYLGVSRRPEIQRNKRPTCPSPTRAVRGKPKTTKVFSVSEGCGYRFGDTAIDSSFCNIVLFNAEAGMSTSNVTPVLSSPYPSRISKLGGTIGGD